MTYTDAKNDYYPYFDYLRILLACVVMLGHDKFIFIWPHSGNLAVQIFFALSGWLIGGVLLDLSAKELPRFYLNRAVRIWIPYYFAFALLVVASLLKDPVNAKWAEFIFYKLSFVYNLFGPPQLASFRDQMPLHGTGNHFWSVNAEEQFYLLSPFLLVLFAQIGRHVVLWVSLAALAWWFNIYGSIVFGVLAAVAVKNFGEIHLATPVRIGLLAGAVGSATGMALGYSYDLMAPLLAISLVLLLAARGKQQPFGKFVGGMSYPLYLNHWIGVFVGNSLLSPFGLRDSPVRQFIAIVINLAVAALMYWYIDRRVLALRGFWFSEARGRAIMFASYGMVAIGITVGLVLSGRI